MTALRVVALAMAFALATWIGGWWAVPVVALVAGASWRRPGVAPLSALAASLGWAMLVVVDAMDGRLGALGTAVAGVLRMPVVALMVITLAFAALAAWSAAVIGSEVARRITAA